MDDIETVARFIAARKMGLIKDYNGIKLHDFMWHEYRDQASALLENSELGDALEHVETLVFPL